MTRRSRYERRMAAAERAARGARDGGLRLMEPGEEPASSLTPSSRDSYDAAAVIDDAGNDDRDDVSFGQLLRRERELRKITLREVNEATKINIRYLEALERNDFTFLPAGAFTRGFIKAYARYVGLDPSQMIDAYLYELKRQEDEAEKDPSRPRPAIDDPVRDAYSDLHEESARKRQKQRAILLTLAIIIGLVAVTAAAYFLWNQARGLAEILPSSRVERSYS